MSFPIPHTNPVQYQQVRETLQTGDLLFFAGSSAEDFMIEALDVAAGDPPYSHVGMVIRDGSELYFWDAPGGGNIFRDPYAARPRNRLHAIGITSHPGCRVAPLDLVLTYYMKILGGHFWVRHLTPSVTREQFHALRIFIDRVDGLPFPIPVETALPANYAAGQKGITLFAGTYFCAQLAADSYLHMGVLSADQWPANSYSPGALASSDPAKLPLVPPFALGDPIYVAWGSAHDR